MGAAAALCENRIPEAEALLRAHLAQQPNDVAALRMLAEVAARLLRYSDAQRLLERCLELAPSFDAARHNYATVLNRQGRSARGARSSARGCSRRSRTIPATAACRRPFRPISATTPIPSRRTSRCCEQYPQQPKLWMSYGHALRTTGKVSESIAAYRRALSLEPRPSARPGGAWRISRLSASATPTCSPCAQALARDGSRRRGPAALRVRARQGARGRRVLRGLVHPLRRG